jgi:hypothetical protein
VQENSFFLPSDFEIWDVRFFFSYCCPAIIITIAPQIFPIIVLQPTKPWRLIP